MISITVNWHNNDFQSPISWRRYKMNYYEHRLMEIRQQIDVLSCRKDAEEQIKQLKHERKQILKQIHGEDI